MSQRGWVVNRPPRRFAVSMYKQKQKKRTVDEPLSLNYTKDKITLAKTKHLVFI